MPACRRSYPPPPPLQAVSVIVRSTYRITGRGRACTTTVVDKVDLMYGKGFDLHGELLDLGCTIGLLSKSGAW